MVTCYAHAITHTVCICLASACSSLHSASSSSCITYSPGMTPLGSTSNRGAAKERKLKSRHCLKCTLRLCPMQPSGWGASYAIRGSHSSRSVLRLPCIQMHTILHRTSCIYCRTFGLFSHLERRTVHKDTFTPRPYRDVAAKQLAIS